MTWTREITRDGLPLIQRHESGGHITAVGMGAARWFDAWGPPGSAKGFPWNDAETGASRSGRTGRPRRRGRRWKRPRP